MTQNYVITLYQPVQVDIGDYIMQIVQDLFISTVDPIDPSHTRNAGGFGVSSTGADFKSFTHAFTF